MPLSSNRFFVDRLCSSSSAEVQQSQTSLAISNFLLEPPLPERNASFALSCVIAASKTRGEKRGGEGRGVKRRGEKEGRGEWRSGEERKEGKGGWDGKGYERRR
eukprot:763382-Hanusia_phi.AAC.1